MAAIKLSTLLAGSTLVAGLALASITPLSASEADAYGLDFSEAKAQMQDQSSQPLTNREQLKQQIGEIEGALISLFQGDYEGALKQFREAANNGNPAALNSLAVMYEKGMGVEVDYAEARNWYQVAIEHGSFDALYNLAVLYAEAPYGVQQDIPKALALFDRACEDGDIGACDYAQELRDQGVQ